MRLCQFAHMRVAPCLSRPVRQLVCLSAAVALAHQLLCVTCRLGHNQSAYANLVADRPLWAHLPLHQRLSSMSTA
jgi:hypothetical protein